MKPDTAEFLKKAERALKAAHTLADADQGEFAVGRAYYAMFYGASAALREKDITCRRHSGVHAAFGLHFAKAGSLDPKYHRWLLDAFDERLQGDYGFSSVLSGQDIEETIRRAGEFIAAVKRVLSTGSP